MPISLKQRYPFRLATTSFVHPADYVSNVRRLAPLVDEIELLFLDSEHLPTDSEINMLKDLAGTLDIGYNVHLPMDISLADPSPSIRLRSREAVLAALDQAAPLNASTHTLHVTYQESDKLPSTVQAWQARAMDSLARLLEKMPMAANYLSVETLDFPPHWLAPVVSRLDLPVCVDVGHVIRFGYDLRETLDLFDQRIAIFHLHGVSGSQDHCALNYLSVESRQIVASRLGDFHGSASLEVFSYQALKDSMACFRDLMNRG